MGISISGPPPTAAEVEKLRLVLSTFQDGTGQYPLGPRRSLPGWRDFERAVAMVFGGLAVESKAVFDVLFPEQPSPEFGVSCKSRGELEWTRRKGRVYMELSNSLSAFIGAIEAAGIRREEYPKRASEIGAVILATVVGWHEREAEELGISREESSYLSLSYDRDGVYQLHQFALDLPDATSLRWSFPTRSNGQPGKRLLAEDGSGAVLEFYYGAGGQLKYYPMTDNAIWRSEEFKLEGISEGTRLFDPLTKAAIYFEQLWNVASRS